MTTDPDCLEGPGRTREEMAADARALDAIAPTPADKFQLMFSAMNEPTNLPPGLPPLPPVPPGFDRWVYRGKGFTNDHKPCAFAYAGNGMDSWIDDDWIKYIDATPNGDECENLHYLEAVRDELAPATEAKGCERETPLTDEFERADCCDLEHALDFARDLELKLGERDEQLRYVKALLDTSERNRKALSDAADHLNARLREEQSKLAEARRALEDVRSDCQCVIDQYNQNGPQWTSRESGAEYYDASYVVESSNERIATIDEALARIDAPLTPNPESRNVTP